MIRWALGIAVACVVPVAAVEAANLSADQARAKAIGILQGDPYGTTPAAVARGIKETTFLSDGRATPCRRNEPLWQFHVVVDTGQRGQFKNGVIDGYLWLDARNGRKLCANLPMLD